MGDMRTPLARERERKAARKRWANLIRHIYESTLWSVLVAAG